MTKRLLIVVALLWASPALAIGTINIANAPEWQQNHAYILGHRVVAGPALTIPNTYTNGSHLYLWAVTTAGTSSGSGNGPQTCASPAGTGGIPTGSWGGATTASDGSVTWTCLTKVDYVSITGFTCDDSRSWTAGATYNFIDMVVNPNNGNCYTNNTGFSGANPCTAAGSGTGPSGTTFNSPETDNACRWYYAGKLTYSSQANRLPHQTWNAGPSPPVNTYTMNYAQNVTVQLWWGGNQRTHYGPGEANELEPMDIGSHQDRISDAPVFCQGSTTTTYEDCASLGVPFFTTLTAPPGDRIYDNIAPGTGPLRYDETKGVAIYTNAATGPAWGAHALGVGDSAVIYDGLQIQATHDTALFTTPNSGQYQLSPSNTNESQLHRSIIIGDGPAAMTTDYGWLIDNSLIISTSATAGSTPIHVKYQTLVHDSTLVCAPGTTDSTGLEQVHYLGTYTVPPMNNNLILGCAHPYAFGDTFSTSGANNATDVSGTPSGTFTDPSGFGVTLNASAFPGTTLTGLTAANQIVNPTVGTSFDGRVKNTSADIYGAGAAFSFSQSGGSLAWASPVTPGTDILGTVRPVSGRHDIGAEMLVPWGVPAIVGPR